MGVQVLEGKEKGAVMYCTTDGWAFGPVFNSSDQAETFLKWLDGDPRKLDLSELEKKYSDFIDEWRHCGLSGKEAKRLDELANRLVTHASTISGNEKREWRALECKVEDARYERWETYG